MLQHTFLLELNEDMLHETAVVNSRIDPRKATMFVLTTQTRPRGGGSERPHVPMLQIETLSDEDGLPYLCPGSDQGLVYYGAHSVGAEGRFACRRGGEESYRPEESYIGFAHNTDLRTLQKE